jgi:hypothetical protein
VKDEDVGCEKHGGPMRRGARSERERRHDVLDSGIESGATRWNLGVLQIP